MHQKALNISKQSQKANTISTKWQKKKHITGKRPGYNFDPNRRLLDYNLQECEWQALTVSRKHCHWMQHITLFSLCHFAVLTPTLHVVYLPNGSNQSKQASENCLIKKCKYLRCTLNLQSAKLQNVSENNNSSFPSFCTNDIKRVVLLFFNPLWH